MSSQCRSHTRAVKDWDAKKEKWERNIMQRDMTTSRTFFQFCSQFTCRRKRRRRRKGPKKIQSWEKKGMASVTITACESVNCLLLHVVVGISLSVSFSLTVGRGLKRRRGKNITLTRRPGEEREVRSLFTSSFSSFSSSIEFLFLSPLKRHLRRWNWERE